jgi:hypothetical protein
MAGSGHFLPETETTVSLIHPPGAGKLLLAVIPCRFAGGSVSIWVYR